TGRTPNHVLVAVLDAEPPPLSEQLPAALQQIVNRALAKKRAERYQAVTEMSAALQQAKKELEFAEQLQDARTSGAPAIETHEVTTAHTTSNAEYIVGEIKRHRLAALAVLLIVLGVVAGFIYYGATRSPSAAIDSLAVLPFVNQTRTPETDDLAD